MSITDGAPPDGRGAVPLLLDFPSAETFLDEPDTAEVSRVIEPDLENLADQAGSQAQFVTHNIVNIPQEWAGDSESDSDSEMPPRETRRQDMQRQRDSQQVEDHIDVHRVGLVSTSREWAGAGLSISSDEFEAAPARVQRRPHGAGGIQESPREASSTSVERQHHSRPWKRCLHIGIFSAMNTADLVMRIWSLVTLWGKKELGYCCIIVPLQLLSTLLSAYITFHDPDVLFWLHRLAAHRPACRPLAMSMVCCLFSCLQMIQVKRAVARQLHAAEVMTEMTENAREDREDARATTASSLQAVDMKPFGGSEKCLPVALFTGVPYLITMVYATQRRDWIIEEPNNYYLIMFSISIAVCLLTVCMAIIEIDVAVSAYVFKRYHFNPALKGTCAGNYHWIYRLFHWSFRIFEVSMRILVISWFVLMLSSKVVIVLIFDYVVGVVILRMHAPRQERLTVHVLVGVALMVADLAHFVDQPNFAEPARYISRLLQIWRFLQVIVLCVLGYFWRLGGPSAWYGSHFFRWELRLMLLLGSTIFYYILRLSAPIRIVGQDLHTAARSGNQDRVAKLLKPNTGGQVLDVNGRTKDTMVMTPAMFAASFGYTEVLKRLVGHGADLNLENGSGNTCLHLAAKNGHVETCRYLVRNGSQSHVKNKKNQQAQDIVDQQACCCGHPAVETIVLLEFLRGEAENPGRSASTRQMSSRYKKFYAVNAEVIGAANISTLQNLFPDSTLRGDLDAPPPQTLHSVSGLLAARSCGMLARRVLNPLSTGGPIQLGALRRIGHLGAGGFGRVVEVELPYEAHTSLPWRRSGAPRRFALKLQPKAENQQSAASEVLALQRANHPFIVRLMKAFQTPKHFALLLELCPTDLNRLLVKGIKESDGECPGLPPAKAAQYMGQILLALVHLHDSEGIVYRDVKPENILISRNDEAKLTDFGLARTASSSLASLRAGTHGFLPPELTEMRPPQASLPGRSPRGGSPRPSVADISVVSVANSTFTEGGYLRDTFKMDAYSFGVTMQLTLLGSYGGKMKDVRSKGAVLLPLMHTEQENIELLDRMVEVGQLSPEGRGLLVDELLPEALVARACLWDLEVMEHRFFLDALECDDLKEYLLPEFNSYRSSVSSTGTGRVNRQGSSGTL